MLSPFSFFKKFAHKILRYFWCQFDFDGFYGVILEKDDSISKRYQGW
jgi:hypothetical protein